MVEDDPFHPPTPIPVKLEPVLVGLGPVLSEQGVVICFVVGFEVWLDATLVALELESVSVMVNESVE